MVSFLQHDSNKSGHQLSIYVLSAIPSMSRLDNCPNALVHLFPSSWTLVLLGTKGWPCWVPMSILKCANSFFSTRNLNFNTSAPLKMGMTEDIWWNVRLKTTRWSCTYFRQHYPILTNVITVPTLVIYLSCNMKPVNGNIIIRPAAAFETYLKLPGTKKLNEA